jgi:hypothetical protein
VQAKGEGGRMSPRWRRGGQAGEPEITRGDVRAIMLALAHIGEQLDRILNELRDDDDEEEAGPFDP